MPRKALLLSVLVAASWVLAQSRPAARADAGVPAARPAAVDAGVPATATAQSGPTPEVEKLRKELTDLKLRTAELERQGQAKADALNEQFEKLTKRLEEMKGQLTKLSDAEDRRADAEEAAQAKRVATSAASASLNTVLTGFSSGNTAGADASLRYAETAFSGTARNYVQLARAALGQGDLTASRGYVILALMEADSQR